jgi:signal transduction histidine kinase
VLRALNGPDVRVAVEARAPDAPPVTLRLPTIEWLVNQYAETLADRRAVVTIGAPQGATRFLALLDWRGGVEHLRIVAPIGAEFAVIELRQPPLVRVIGLPTGFWVGVLGFLLALLAIVAIVRESRPLGELSTALSRFGADGVPAPVIPRGAADVRRLIETVNEMQGRIAALLTGRTILLGAVSHDLKTFVTRLRLRVEDLPDESARYKAVRDLDDMTRLIDDSLALARGQAVPEAATAVNLAALVADELAIRDEPRLTMTPTAAPVWVRGHAASLQRLLANLLDNALRYAGRASVQVSNTPTHIVLDVDDDGPGIPADQRQAVFEPFVRLERSRSRETGGSGLGLAIVRRIAEAHGGEVEVLDSPLGGARFQVRWPIQGGPSG